MRIARLVTQLSLAVVIVGGVIGLSFAQEPARGRATAPRGQISQIPAEAELAWPLPASAKAYDTIDGHRMKGYVEELAAISRKSRDAGNRSWGRIVGTPSMDETQQWVAAKYRSEPAWTSR